MATAQPTRVSAAIAAAAKITAQRRRALLFLHSLEAELVEVNARIAVLERVLTKQQSTAWCADFTEDATGSVATIDIPDEGKLALIAPSAPAPTATDGALAAREAMMGYQLYWCAAALPGVQKWRPNYRRGVITALDVANDLADVTLISADTSSAEALGINQATTLTAVPVQYMSCNAGAFEVGDACVVRFTARDWAQPVVVGFVDNPKPCEIPDIHLIFYCGTAPGGDVPALVRSHSSGGVNYGGLIEDTGEYRSLGIVLATNRTLGGMHLTDVTQTTDYRIPIFYNGKPLLYRKTSVNEYSGTAAHAFVTIWRTGSLTHGTTVLANGTYQQDTESYVSENQVLTEKHETQTWNNFPAFGTPASAGVPNANVISEDGPWAAWSSCQLYLENGTTVVDFYAPSTYTVVSDSYTIDWNKYSLPTSLRVPTASMANLALIPNRTAVDTVIPYVSSTFTATPLTRYQLDFGYLPYTIDTTKVRAVGKDVAWHWVTANDIPGNPGAWVNIVASNYKNTANLNITAPEFFAPYPLPTDYIPPNVVLADTWAVLAKNDTTGPYFWLWVYAVNVTAGTWALQKRITNKPGVLGAGFEDVVQISTPSLPADSYLIGAMRDEVVCM